MTLYKFMLMKDFFSKLGRSILQFGSFVSRSYAASTASPYTRVAVATAINILLSLLLFTIGRVVYLLVNLSLFMPMTFSNLLEVFSGGMVFDLAAMAYVNIVYIVLMLIPFHLKESFVYQIITKCIFIVSNAIALGANMVDSVYYPYIKRRSTVSVFNEFSNDSGIYKVIFMEMANSWYLLLLFVALIYASCKLYRMPKRDKKSTNYKIYYPLQALFLIFGVMMSIFSIRGGVASDLRPITISNSCQYVSNQKHAELVLNTPFTFIRTFRKPSFVPVHYFKTEAELTLEYTPVHQPQLREEPKAKNVVVIIMESFGREYIGALNKGSRHPGYTPFLDSLIGKSLTFERSFANGHKSIDAMPSIMSSIPMFVEPFFLTERALNSITSIGGELRKEGYNTSFFHGASNGSMGFLPYSKAAGIETYYGRTEYGNDDDFDGAWAIWDEEFFSYFASNLSTFNEPFAAAIFSASSHHPFRVPERYAGHFDKGTIPIHQCIGYSDNALRLFFKKIENEPYFKNTLFVITADHTNRTAYPEEMNSVETFAVPIIFYQAGSDLSGVRNTIAQQIDIMPTVLSYLGHDKPYLAFGRDLLNTPDEDGEAVNYLGGIYQLIKGDYVLRYDGEQVVGFYDYTNDRAMIHDLKGKGLEEEKAMVKHLKAILQQYMNRMVEDRLTIETDAKHEQEE